MSCFQFVVTSTVLVATAQTAVMAASPPQASGRVGTLVLPPLTPLKQDCPAIPQPITTVRIVIPRSLSLTENERFVRFSTNTSTNDDEREYNNSSINKTNDSAYDNNPFHLDLSLIPRTPLAGAPIEYIRVRVILRDKDLKFYQDAAKAIYGIAYTQSSNFVPWICQFSADALSKTRKGKNVATFYIARRSGGEIAAINFLLVGDSAAGAAGDDTPIIIDPKVKNDG